MLRSNCNHGKWQFVTLCYCSLRERSLLTATVHSRPYRNSTHVHNLLTLIKLAVAPLWGRGVWWCSSTHVVTKAFIQTYFMNLMVLSTFRLVTKAKWESLTWELKFPKAFQWVVWCYDRFKKGKCFPMVRLLLVETREIPVENACNLRCRRKRKVISCFHARRENLIKPEFFARL